MPEGLIVKALSGYYYVMPDDDHEAIVQCRARGLFRKKEISPLVGDRVLFERSDHDEGTVTEIQPRSSELLRPPIANVDQAVLVFAITEPSLNVQLLDKFLVHIEYTGIDAVLCFSKSDLLEQDQGLEIAGQNVQGILDMYENIGYPVVLTSTRKSEGIDQLKVHLKDRISVFAGQSGVGKSSLLNTILPNLNLETAEISIKLGRGKHTTRHVELISIKGQGWVADTPGFSQLDFLDMELEDLSRCFKEFRELSEQCKFRGCSHQHEPKCKVLAAVEQGDIAASRYKNYIFFLEELKEKRRNEKW
jgi:ribosome biogenesis GTPase